MNYFYKFLVCLLCAIPALSFAQEVVNEDSFKPEIHGNIRGKFEYQPEIDMGRFQVRNARMSVSGLALSKVAYKAEIDLSDQGVTRMLDAYVKLLVNDKLSVAIGQMRVPFTIDAHRSPYSRFFANRSFIGKQVGDVRDVGTVVSYKNSLGSVPFSLEGGIFNGDGLTDQKEWQTNYNHSLKAQFLFNDKWNVTISEQMLKPSLYRVNMYDLGTYYKTGNFHVEFEYLYKMYERNAFDDVHSVDVFAMYNVPVKGFFQNISFLARYDMMTDHSDGEMSDAEIAAGELWIDDAARHRATGGVTLSLSKMFHADIRLNYEKYFYRDGAESLIDTSEMDKFVVEFVCKF
ncbi:MAG: porin [Rikenellaceae bacterium]